MAETDLKNVEELLKAHGEVMTRTCGTSMQPLLRQGRDIVVIKKPQFPLKVGDVPIYKVKNKKEPVLHRILKVNDDGSYIIRGDNLFFKEHVFENQIVGVMRAFYREGKYCECEKSLKYKVYVFLNRISYPLRCLRSMRLLPPLSKIKHKIFK